MKKFTIEDKVKRYDELIAMAKECITNIPDEAVTKYMLNMFPELEESENERIRKEIVRFIQMEVENEMAGNKWIAWLEKQCEQREQLINKACDVLVNCIEDFMLRRMEIWDEECKKQTLENLRKKLEE